MLAQIRATIWNSCHYKQPTVSFEALMEFFKLKNFR